MLEQKKNGKYITPIILNQDNKSHYQFQGRHCMLTSILSVRFTFIASFKKLSVLVNTHMFFQLNLRHVWYIKRIH